MFKIKCIKIKIYKTINTNKIIFFTGFYNNSTSLSFELNFPPSCIINKAIKINSDWSKMSPKISLKFKLGIQENT